MSNPTKAIKESKEIQFKTQQEVADFLGVTKQAVAKAIKNKRKSKGFEILVMDKDLSK